MNRFTWKNDESFEQRCGEIFSTTNGRISIHCTLCEEIYRDFELYQSHLNEVHCSTSFKFEIQETDLVKEAAALTQTLESYLDNYRKEINEFLNTPEIETDSIVKMEQVLTPLKEIKKMRKKSHLSHSKKGSTSKNKWFEYVPSNILKNPNNSTDLIIPTEIREVKRFENKNSISEEDRKHKCPICSLAFKDKANMKHHFKRHSHERNHACTECDKRFYTSTELSMHKRCHTKERPLLCNECGQTFSFASSLNSHVKKHRNQKDYHCRIPGCKKSFYNNWLLKNHMRSHSAERPFPCTLCDSAFKRPIALKNHMKLHENKREYKCELCEADFNQQAGLFSHMKTSHKII